ncbi:DNA repair exonuclease [Bacillus salacetis]|uniref:DNA repair exonuclease n=2 Tax=Bacillus salacetis TaxID=2315464 RepID=A0A3A1QTW6_9BACI|nr:DNA repair exonuclease [Bacillus salacetis]
MNEIRFIHTADLHLDSPFKGLKHLPEELFQRVRNSTFRSLERIVDNAIRLEVDFVLMAGDLYDEEDRSIRAQARLKNQLERLNEAGISVYVIHGNHDYLGNYWSHLDMPANVKVFGDTVEKVIHYTADGTPVHLYGFSYDTRHIHERKIADYPAARKDGGIYIGLLHGSEAGETTDHEPYAPFSISELKEKNYHYWALGHIHVRKELSAFPPIVYPGNIQGRHRKETGPKGCYFVTVADGETKLEFLETQEIIWEKISISLKGVLKLSQIYELCKAGIEQCRRKGGTLLEMEFSDTEETGGEILNKIKTGEILEAFQDGEEHREDFVWVHSMRIDRNGQLSYFKDQETFMSDMIQTVKSWSDQEWDEVSSDLFLHPQAHRYIELLDNEEKEEMKQSAAEMLASSFSKRGYL